MRSSNQVINEVDYKYFLRVFYFIFLQHCIRRSKFRENIENFVTSFLLSTTEEVLSLTQRVFHVNFSLFKVDPCL